MKTNSTILKIKISITKNYKSNKYNTYKKKKSINRKETIQIISVQKNQMINKKRTIMRRNKMYKLLMKMIISLKSINLTKIKFNNNKKKKKGKHKNKIRSKKSHCIKIKMYQKSFHNFMIKLINSNLIKRRFKTNINNKTLTNNSQSMNNKINNKHNYIYLSLISLKYTKFHLNNKCGIIWIIKEKSKAHLTVKRWIYGFNNANFLLTYSLYF